MKYLLILLFLFSTHSFAKVEIWDCPYTDGSGRQIFKISYEKKTIFVRSKNPVKWVDMAHKLGTVTYRVNFDYENDVATVEWSYDNDVWTKHRTFDLVLKKVIWARPQTCTVIN